MHRRKEEDSVDRADRESSGASDVGSGEQRVDHYDGMQALRVPFDRDANRLDVARNTPDNNGFVNAVVIHFHDPPVGQIFGRFGDFPAKQGADVRPGFLFGQQPEKWQRKKVNMRVGNFDFSPRRSDHSSPVSFAASAISSFNLRSTW